MPEPQIRYDRMVERAMRSVVREALAQVAKSGLPGEHHFYLTFKTTHAGVAVPEAVAARYPQEMTIVLQHQFYGLEVTDERFAVTLSFGGSHQRLVVPFAAVTAFADPSVNFALQFEPRQPAAAPAAPPAAAAEKKPPALQPAPPSTAPASPPPEATPDGAKVVTLDNFRRR